MAKHNLVGSRKSSYCRCLVVRSVKMEQCKSKLCFRCFRVGTIYARVAIVWKYEVLLLTNLITHSHYGLAQLKHMDSYCLFKLKRGRESARECERERERAQLKKMEWW